MKKYLLILISSLALISMVACGANEAETADSTKTGSTTETNGDKVIVFIPKISGNSFFESGNKGAQEHAKKQGLYTVKYDGNPEASVANQVTIVNNAIQQNADAIVISSVDADGLGDVLKEALGKGIPVVTWDSDVAPDARNLMVSQGTPEQLGEMLVDMGSDSLEKRGKDPMSDKIKYSWHYSQSTVTDQNSWQEAGEKYIAEKYPNWVNVAKDNYYSEQDAEKAIAVGESILSANKDIDLIICNDSTALPGQLQAAQNMGLNKDDVTITGFASPNSIKDYAKADVIEQWGLWDVKVQGAIATYLGYYLAEGNKVKVGEKIDIKGIGSVEVMPNSSIDAEATDSEDSGVVLLPERTIFTKDNVDEYDF